MDDLSSVRIIDWGDASVGHPFGTMLATLNSIAFHAGVLRADRRMDDPRVLRIRDAYLEPFTSLGSRKELLRWVRWPEHRLRDSRDLLGKGSPRRAGDGGRSRGVPGTRVVAGAARAVGGRGLRRGPHSKWPGVNGAPTARPLILRGLISMNRFRTPSAQGTGPVSQADWSR